MSKSVRIDDDVLERIDGLPGKTLSDRLRGLLDAAGLGAPTPANDSRMDEALDLLRSIAAVMPKDTIPDSEQMEMIVDVTMQRKIDERAASRPPGQSFDPRAVAGVQVGAGNLRPPRESGQQRAERVTALDSIDDPSIDRSPEFVSQG